MRGERMMLRPGIAAALAAGVLAWPGGSTGDSVVPGVSMATDTTRVAPANPSIPTGPAGGEDVTRVRSTRADRESVTVTVYNQNFGLVREIRSLPVGVGPVALEYGDVASAIQTATVHVRPLGGRFRILEQNYQYDLLSPQKLLEKYVGKTVTVYRYDPATEREQAVEATVLSVNNGTILKIGDEITFNYPGRIAFPEVPDNLIAEPTLVWLGDSGSREQRLEVSYLTNQLNWQSDYVMVIGEDDREADLTGWVTLTNNSGATYDNAQLKLVAGDVQRLRDRNEVMKMAADVAARAVSEQEGFSEEGFFEYHLYTLGRPTTLGDHEQKQVTLLEASRLGVDKRLIFYGAAYYYRGSYGQVASNQKVGVFLDFENSEKNRLGMPLPAGVVRVYKEDSSGAQQFIGEDRIDHTPRDERVRIRMGDAFDVVGDRRQMNYTVVSSCVSESTWEVELRNHKDEDVDVQIVEPVGGDWRILRSSHRATRTDAHTFRFDLEVPSRDSVKVEYTVRVRWC